MRAASALGDSALLLPASLALLAWFAWRDPRGLAAPWLVGLVACWSVTIAAKLGFGACGPNVLGAVSPSGHASFALLFYGGLATFFGSGRGPRVATPVRLAAIGLAVLIGVSRVATGAHTATEVAIGVAIGAGALALLVVLYARAGRPRLPAWPLALGLGVALLLLGGRQFSLEPLIGRAAARLAADLAVCGDP